VPFLFRNLKKDRAAMKVTLIILLALALGVIFTEFDISPKESSFTRQYILPFMRDSVEPGLQSVLTDAEISFRGGEDEALRDPAPQSAELRRVIDGDTIDVFIGGEVERVRYIAANTPEFGEPCYQESSLANRQLLEGQTLTLERDETDRDANGRLLRYVFANGVLVERQLISLGYAEVVRYRSDDNYYQEFRALEEMAAEQGLGCHESGIFDDGSLVR
jgi:endonuclease YncB( thermonuclease family)